MNDPISRQDAINAICKGCTFARPKERCAIDCCSDVKRLKELPTHIGEWIDYTEDGHVECPFCHSATNCNGDKDELHFCFNCGAQMKGGNK